MVEGLAVKEPDISPESLKKMDLHSPESQLHEC